MTIASNTAPILANGIYHIYNRAVGFENLFTSVRDHLKFLDNVKENILPHCDIYAYCLLPNHFHFLLQVKEYADKFSKGMSDACNSYAKYFNTRYNRKGGLFMSPFKRKAIEDDAGVVWVAWYLHRNPLHHKLTNDWQSWTWSSYKAYSTNSRTLLQTSFLLDIFGSREQLIKHHELNQQGWIDEDME
jgi:putative transposase